MAWNQHQRRDRWAAGGTQLAACTHFEKFCALSGGLSRPSASETTPPPPPPLGRFCPSKLWASRHTRQTELPSPSPRDQWSLGKESKTRTRGCQTSPCRREEEEHEQQPPPEQLLGRCSSVCTTQAFHQREAQRLQHPMHCHHPGHGQCRDAAAAVKPRQDSSSVRWMSTLWCRAHGFPAVFFLVPQSSVKPSRCSLATGRKVRTV